MDPVSSRLLPEEVDLIKSSDFKSFNQHGEEIVICRNDIRQVEGILKREHTWESESNNNHPHTIVFGWRNQRRIDVALKYFFQGEYHSLELA